MAKLKVALKDRDRNSMLFLNSELHFTYDSPGPIEVELDDLDETLKNRLLYNCRRNLLVVDDQGVLEKACEGVPAAAKTYSTPAERPIEQPQLMEKELAAEKTRFRKILKGKIPSVKKEAAQLRPGQLRSLMEFEEKGKNRKKLMSFFRECLDRLEKAVAARVGDQDAGDSIHPVMVPAQTSDQVSDVVDSEEVEQVILLPSDQELEEAEARD
jgi:hypothetical protein